MWQLTRIVHFCCLHRKVQACSIWHHMVAVATLMFLRHLVLNMQHMHSALQRWLLPLTWCRTSQSTSHFS